MKRVSRLCWQCVLPCLVWQQRACVRQGSEELYSACLKPLKLVVSEGPDVILISGAGCSCFFALVWSCYAPHVPAGGGTV